MSSDSKTDHLEILTRHDENANQIQRSRTFGRLEGAVAKLVGQEVVVTRADVLGPHYRLLTLSGEGLRGKRWRPGQAFQILFAGWQARAYTPFRWSPEGELSFLAHVHGGRGGVAGEWLATAPRGERCLVFGPRWSLDLAALPRPLVFFGDETSLGTVAAMPGLECIFEVDDVEAARAALDAMTFRGDVTLLKRAADRSHLDAVRERFARSPSAHGAFTGDAASIKFLYGALRKDGVSSKRLTNKAYWAAGKRGLE